MRRLLVVVLLALAVPSMAAPTSTSSTHWTPSYEYWGANAVHLAGGTTLDAEAERYAVIFRAPKAGTLGKVRIRFGTVSVGATTTLRVSWQTVDPTTGVPDETDDQFRVIPNVSLVGSTSVLTGLITTDGTDGGTKRTVTRGETLALVVKYETFNASDSVAVVTSAIGTRQGRNHFDYIASNTTGSYVKQGAFLAVASLQYDDGTYAESVGVLPVIVPGTTVYSNTSTPDEIGLRFQLSYPSSLCAAWLGVDADGDFDLVLYDGVGGTVVASVDKDFRHPTVGMTGFLGFSSADTTLAANTAYILALRPTSATNITLSHVDVAEAAELNQWGGGTQFMYATAKDPTTTANFTTTATRLPMIGLGLCAFDDGVSTVGAPLIGPGGLIGD